MLRKEESQQYEALKNRKIVGHLNMWVFNVDEVKTFCLLINSNEEKKMFYHPIIKVFWRSVLSVNVCVFIPWIFIISVRWEV